MTEHSEESCLPRGVLTTRSERLMASGYWLLSAAESGPQARTEWDRNGAAWLRPGELFVAVTVPAGLVHAEVGLPRAEECAAPLAEVLAGGPLFYQRERLAREGTYTALLPASVSRVWGQPGTVAHPHRELLLIPAPDRCEPAGERPWWVVPLGDPGLLCPPERLADLVALGREATGRGVGVGRPGGDDGA
jgi:hypothetical protein